MCILYKFYKWIVCNKTTLWNIFMRKYILILKLYMYMLFLYMYFGLLGAAKQAINASLKDNSCQKIQWTWFGVTKIQLYMK